MEKQWVHWQEVELTAGSLPLALLRRAVERVSVPGHHLQNIGLKRDGERILLCLCFGQCSLEEKLWEK